LCLLLALTIGAPPRVSNAEIIDRIVATIDGEPVTRSDVDRYGREHGDAGIEPRAVLDSLVTDRLLHRKADDLGISIEEADVDRYIEGVRSKRGMNEAAFEKALRGQGLTAAGYRSAVRTELERSEIVNREIRNRVTVSPEEIRRYFEAHADDYTMAQRVRVRMITIVVPAAASADRLARAEVLVRSLHARIEAGEDFAALARAYSQGPGAADGGDLGFFERGQMVKQLEDVAFRLKAGTLSQPIRSAAGFHLMKIEEREGSTPQPFAAVKEQIRAEMYDAALRRRYQRWLREDLRQAYHVEILW